MAQLSECPDTLKKIQHHLKIALEHDTKDPVISYWCRLYALQTALTIDKSSKEAKIFLVSLMDWLEKQKIALKDNDMITNETAAQAHFENYAIRLFNLADGMDRQANYNKNTVKLFFTAGLLMDVLSVFGDVSEEITNTQKYAKWKAMYIHNCMKNGETPTPGPPVSGSGEDIGFNFSNQGENIQLPTNNFTPFPPTEHTYNDYPASKPNEYPQIPNTSTVDIAEIQSPVSGGPILLKDGIQITPAQITKAQKYCKFAASALNYDDVAESITNLQKALKLLTTEYLRTGKKYRATPRGFLKQSIPSFREEFESYSLVSIKIKIIRYTTFLFTKRRTPRYKSGFKFLWRSDIITL